MTNKWIPGLLTLIVAAMPVPVVADTLALSHTCTQPYKPAQFAGNTEVAMFNESVAEFKQCIASFAEEQHEAAALHRRAANAAIDAWNAFVDDNDLN
jgi:hypothetical protein